MTRAGSEASGVLGRRPPRRRSDGPPFEIGMSGLGLLLSQVRLARLEPTLSRIRRGGGLHSGEIPPQRRRALCLPFLRWVHRGPRPLGTPYPMIPGDAFRNYLIAFEELGIPTASMIEHFFECGSADVCGGVLSALKAEETSPFRAFGGLFCIYEQLDEQQIREGLSGQSFNRSLALMKFRKLPISVRSRPGVRSATSRICETWTVFWSLS